jgi:hypothetical protein
VSETTEVKIEMWDCSEDAEELSHIDQHDAIESYLDEALYNLPIAEWPETITAYGFARMQVSYPNLPDHALEAVVERLDEEYGSPNEATTITPKMKEAAAEFVQKILAEYQVWSCKRVASEEINVMEWVKENAPGWLTEKPENQQAGG